MPETVVTEGPRTSVERRAIGVECGPYTPGRVPRRRKESMERMEQLRWQQSVMTVMSSTARRAVLFRKQKRQARRHSKRER